MMWMLNGNHVRTKSPSAAAGTCSMRPDEAGRSRGEIPDRVRPRPEAARPDARALHHRDDRLFVSRLAQQLDATFEEDPPEVGGVAFVEEHVALVERHDGGRGVELPQLLVAQPFEDEERTELVDGHQPTIRSW